MQSRVVLLTLALAVSGAATASAQLRSGTVEINPFAGYLFGGEFSRSHDNNNFDNFDRTHVDVDDDATYGGRIGYNFTSRFELEAEYSRTETRFVQRQRHLDDQNLGDLRIEYFIGYLTYNFGHGRLVPFVTIGAGGANLNPNVPGTVSDSDTRFTTAAGGGVKYFVNPHFGFRFDGRAYSTWLGDHSHVLCDTGGSCRSRGWVTNATATGGLIVAF